ncbi:hypothetical protein ACIRPX_42505 [Streptomyces sp. NPDC101225]|uniref:hypothetical protein n=1 Tax=Streptomyces sp. NPDC101225 TaxID=3366135 RepID=UPI0038133E59
MAKGASKSAAVELEGQEVSLVNTDDLEYAFMKAERRVLEIQTKLHRWAGDDPHRRFDDLFVRHEALLDRAAVKDRRRGLVAARPRS